MNLFEKILYFIQQLEMETPKPYGWFHLLWIAMTVIAIFLLCRTKNAHSVKFRNRVLATYAIVSWTLEILKQLLFSMDVSAEGLVTWSYQWYAAPFQFCTTPFITAFLLIFLKEGRFKNALISYLGFYTTAAGFATVLMPTTLFVRTIEVNVHTMFIHCGSIVIGLYLLISGNAKPAFSHLRDAFFVFLTYVGIAELLNVFVYQSGVLGSDNVFNMFYISPYFNSSLPVFCDLQPKLPFALFLFLYIFALTTASVLIGLITALLGRISQKKNAVDRVADN